MQIDSVVLSRWQFGATASFHIIFPCLLIGLAWYLTIMEALWLRTKQEVYRIQYQFWVKPFASAFIVAVITGVVLSHQLDTVFGDFYYRTVRILAPIRKIEFINAVLLEAGCFAIMVWGWKKVGNRLHFLATLTVTFGVMISAVCVLARNAWMQTPTGISAIDGRLVTDGWLSTVLSASFPYRFFHTLGAAMLSTALFMLGISAWYLLQGRHKVFAQYALRASIIVISVLGPLQILSGDLHGLNTARYQPSKLAAMEGLWETTRGASLVLFAIPDQDEERNRYPVEIPKLASIIITHDPDGEIKGLKDFPKSDRPNVPIVFFSFRLMAAISVASLALAGAGLILLWRKSVLKNRWFLRLCCAMAPSGFIATIAGWCVAEVGRQPWVIYQVVRTAEITKHLPATDLAQSMRYLAIAYAIVLLMFVCHLWTVIRKGPDEIGANDECVYTNGMRVPRNFS